MFNIFIFIFIFYIKSTNLALLEVNSYLKLHNTDLNNVNIVDDLTDHLNIIFNYINNKDFNYFRNIYNNISQEIKSIVKNEDEINNYSFISINEKKFFYLVKLYPYFISIFRFLNIEVEALKLVYKDKSINNEIYKNYLFNFINLINKNIEKNQVKLFKNNFLAIFTSLNKLIEYLSKNAVFFNFNYESVIFLNEIFEKSVNAEKFNEFLNSCRILSFKKIHDVHLEINKNNFMTSIKIFNKIFSLNDKFSLEPINNCRRKLRKFYDRLLYYKIRLKEINRIINSSSFDDLNTIKIDFNIFIAEIMNDFTDFLYFKLNFEVAFEIIQIFDKKKFFYLEISKFKKFNCNLLRKIEKKEFNKINDDIKINKNFLKSLIKSQNEIINRNNEINIYSHFIFDFFNNINLIFDIKNKNAFDYHDIYNLLISISKNQLKDSHPLFYVFFWCIKIIVSKSIDKFYDFIINVKKFRPEVVIVEPSLLFKESFYKNFLNLKKNIYNIKTVQLSFYSEIIIFYKIKKIWKDSMKNLKTLKKFINKNNIKDINILSNNLSTMLLYKKILFRAN